MLTRLALAFGLLAATAARADGPRRVCVLYFDNNTNQPEYDVLQKGLADMMVTDLSAVDGLEVLEREKLQKLLDELKLQRSSYFDPKTAQKLGAQLGAEYAVTGSIAALSPQLRIDIRLVEVSTGKVEMADKVVGDASKFFDLQQELVDRFVQGLHGKLAASDRARAGVATVDTLLAYSKSVDAADKGDLDGASKRLAEVVRDAPDFHLAQAKYAALLKALHSAVKKHEAALNAKEKEFLEKMEAELSSVTPDQLSPQPDRRAADTYFGWKYAKGQYQVFRIKRRSSYPTNAPYGVHVFAPADWPEIREASAAYLANAEQFADELHAFEKRFPKERIEPNAGSEAKDLGREFGLEDAGDGHWANPWHELSEAACFAVTGHRVYGPTQGGFRPTLGQLDSAAQRRAFALYAKALKLLEDAPEREARWHDRDRIQLLDSWGESLLFAGRKEEAVARWQQILDEYPTYERYKDIQSKVEEALGEAPELKAFEAAMAAPCDASTHQTIANASRPIARVDGTRGVRDFVARVEKHCTRLPPNVTANSYWMTAYTAGMDQALRLGDCKLFDELFGKLKKINEDSAKAMAGRFSACR